ncbi:AAC(3) family N-acetyltransferase [Halobiforma lacisalsi AJ5]|uniref:AAC(3) family N-acetyltransferase n=1 Tax=Natronobacterium lacisalsi AJ5 TaxID=358396 RepID=M0LC99_NATLA|nr:AAC(3) family N-acetyltransferase [Halobiforma lacisalsi]APW99187.1 AAC(3) family N-acetyltransferase [Halobiforma lacisalsi AJ5]EMA30753.1 aminoglycoside N3'-acetyltransferase [Halobiforma lacisalsi AJ5]
MSDPLPEERSSEPITVESLTTDLRDLGVAAGETVLVHGSLSSLGWVCGGAPAVVDALQRVLGEDGTLVMPTHSPGNRDPTNMGNPPVPDSWYDTVREEMPPYRPAVTPTQGIGAIAECFRSYPGVRRSAHPQHSFAAWGADAEFVTGDHPYDYSLGESSPLARVYDLEGRVLFLGTTHATNTSLHLAEYRAGIDIERTSHASAVRVDGDREWVEWEDLDVDDGDFPDCGEAFERAHPDAFESGQVGVGDAKLLDQRPLVDFAVDWFEANRE